MKKNYLNTDLTIASDGNYVHVTESGRENFKKWFKESKVKNLNGSPQIMYHGTYQSFDMFDKNKIGSRFSADNEGLFAISCTKINFLNFDFFIIFYRLLNILFFQKLIGFNNKFVK